jgi:uncharacterized protein (DUF305 family)
MLVTAQREHSQSRRKKRMKAKCGLAILCLCGLSAQSSSGPAWTELISGMKKMHAAMASAEPSGNSDVDFVNLMLPHHQAAIDMARTELTYGKDPQMRRLAQEIITDQQSEIQLMQLWLKQHPRQVRP